MKTEYLTSPEIRKTFFHHTEHELTICLGDNAGDNLRSSLAHARALLDSRRFDAVVYVNLPFTPRRVTDARRDVFPKSENNPNFTLIHNHIGRLGPEFDSVRKAVEAAKGKVAVIINSWEFASSSYRYKEQLLFALHELVCADEVTVFVYAQAQCAVPGEIHRQGLGRLTMFAADVMLMPTEEEVRLMMPPAINEGTSRSGGGVLPSTQEINELRYADSAMMKEGERRAAVA